MSPVSRAADRHRLVLAVLAPALALLCFGGFIVWEKLEDWRHDTHLLAAAQVIEAAEGVAHEVQKERAASVRWVAAGRRDGRDALAIQRAATDDRRRALEAVVAGQRTRMPGRGLGEFGLGRLAGLRADVDGVADVAAVLRDYNALVSHLVGQSVRQWGDDLGGDVAARMDVIHVADRVNRSLEAGMALLAGTTSQQILRAMLLEAVIERRAFAESLRDHLPFDMAELIDPAIGGPLMVELDRLAELMVDRGLDAASIPTWSKAHGQALDALKEAEERLALHTQSRLLAALHRSQAIFYGVVVASLLLMGVALETLRRSERRAWLAQQEARTLFRAMEQSPISVLISDPAGIIEYVNPAFGRLAGYDRDEVIGRTPRLFKSSITPRAVHEDLWRTIAAGHQWRGEMCNRRKDGTLYWEALTVAPVKDAEGATLNFIAFKEDISELKGLRRALEREHDTLRRVLASIHDALCLVDANGRFLYVNSAFEAEFGPVGDRDCKGYFAEHHLDCPVCKSRSHCRHPELAAPREWRSAKTGKVYELVDSAVPTEDGEDSVVQVFHDITLRKQTEAALLDARQAAELANRAKSEFLSVMSHELRTPLNAIIGFSEIIEGQLLGPVGEPQYAEFARDIHTSGTHLLGLINDILDVARIEVGRITLHERELDVAGVVRATLAMVRERADRADVTLDCSFPEDLPALWADERRFKQALLNVLGNAVKFTPAGGRVRVTAAPTGDGGLEVVVADTGIGIAPEDIERVTMAFTQADAGLRRRYEGTGLGLALTRQLMELHGGRLTLASRQGEGTTVTLGFPAARVSSTQNA